MVHFHMKSADLEVGLALLVGQLHLSVLHCCSASEESRLTFPAVTWRTCSLLAPLLGNDLNTAKGQQTCVCTGSSSRPTEQCLSCACLFPVHSWLGYAVHHPLVEWYHLQETILWHEEFISRPLCCSSHKPVSFRRKHSHCMLHRTSVILTHCDLVTDRSCSFRDCVLRGHWTTLGSSPENIYLWA